VRRVQESKTIFTLYLRFTDPVAHASYTYDPGQFNMLYLYGIGEVPISIVSDPEHEDLLVHTINRVGRVTRAWSSCAKATGSASAVPMDAAGRCAMPRGRT